MLVPRRVPQIRKMETSTILLVEFKGRTIILLPLSTGFATRFKLSKEKVAAIQAVKREG